MQKTSIQHKVCKNTQVKLEYTTAVDDIERNAPTNIPSVSLPPHNCNEETAKSTKYILLMFMIYAQNA